MGYYDQTGQFRPGRRSQHRCSVCERVFERNHVPAPDHNGKRICRDCNIKQWGVERYRNGT